MTQIPAKPYFRAAMVLMVLCALSTLSPASVTVYSNRATWLAATSGVTNADFNGIAGPGSFVGYGSGPAVIQGLTFTSNDSMFVIDPAYYGFPYVDGFFNADYTVPNLVTVDLPGSYTAVGFDFGGLFTGGASFDVTLVGVGTFTVSATGSTQDGVLDFAGFTSTAAFTSVILSMPDSPGYNAVDNFAYGGASAVPEPSSIALLGSGLFALAGGLRRKLLR